MKFEVPMERAVYEKLKVQAHHMGFNSVQSYIRFWATAETAGPSQITAFRDMSTSGGQALRYFELILAICPAHFHDMQSAVVHVMKYMNRSITRRKILEIAEAHQTCI